MRRLLAVLGGLANLGGVCLIGIYVHGAIIEPWGDPDQSMTFWALPILFAGIALLVLGAVTFVLLRLTRERGSGIKG